MTAMYMSTGARINQALKSRMDLKSQLGEPSKRQIMPSSAGEGRGASVS